MQNNSFFKHILFACIVVLFASCDKDFNEIGSDIIGEDHFNMDSDLTKTVRATSYDMGAVQSNNLPLNALGIYNNSAFGITTAHFVTQLEFPPSGINPTIDAELVPVIESVILTVPYFSKKTATDTEGAGTYDLDSIYGPVDSKIKLSVYENGYYIRDLDPVGGFQNDQKYYSDQNADFFNAKGTLLKANNAFGFSSAEIVETTTVDGETVITRTAPGMKMNLDMDFFKTKIFEAPAGKLTNNNVFKEWFRGLYFHVENTGSDAGNLAMLNFKQGKVTIKYKEYIKKPVAGEALPERVDRNIVLTLTGNTVNLLENTNPVTPSADRLYLKGGAGSMAVIDLFNPLELDQLRADNWLINEASLTFHIDRDLMGTGLNTRASEPYRIYLYDLNNKRPILVDYYSDNTSASDPKFGKYIHGGIIKKEESGNDKKGIKYKIRLTNYIRNLIKNSDSTNVRLGLVVTEDIRELRSAKLRTPFLAESSSVDIVPLSSVINPLGTILFGSNIPYGDPNYDKRLKLEIYYTKPN